jgi:tetratricopeptide (TPR) repeat protein
MAGVEYIVLISDTLKRHLDGLDASELAKMREKLEFLASGLWDAGLRVKKLKGPAQSVVFEARISKSDRLLFTLGRDRGKSVAYAWGIERHDDVNRAKRSIVPENAPFLGFEPISIEERDELVMDDLSPDYFTQEPVDCVTKGECGPQRWRVLDNEDWNRLLSSAERQKADLRLYLTEEQRRVLEQPPPLFLSGTAGSGKTTIAVYYLFRPLPGGGRRLFVTNHRYLSSYSERLYEGLAAGRPEQIDTPPPRFAAYRDLVREIAAAEEGWSGEEFDPAKEVDLPAFERMLRARKEFSSLDPELAWEEIRGVIKGAKPALNVSRYRDFAERFASGGLSRRETRELEDMLGAMECLDFIPRVEAIIERKTPFADYGDFLRFHSSGDAVNRPAAILVHRYILEGLEKKAADLRKPLLSFSEYQALGKKRAPRFSHDRAGIYAAAEWYQNRLREGGLWDEIDLTRRALEVLSGEAGMRTSIGNPGVESRASKAFEPWDLVVCDEAQDFTNVHLYLLFRLAVDPSLVVMAGDVKQIINPSGFRWADLRALFWERGLSPPDLFRLNLNFRSVGNIVSLGNALLDLKKRLAGIQSDETKESWKFTGRSPCLLHGVDEEEVIETLRGVGAGNAVIVRDASARDRLKTLSRSELVFTVNEAKGLEFDAVLLWKLTPTSGEIAALWRRLAGDDRLAASFEARIVHEINLYYVAVTRARNGLVVYEENVDFWNQGEFEGLYIDSSDLDILKGAWRSVSTPEEWRAQGDYYFEREYWKAAAECYKNSGDTLRESMARGLGLFAERKFAEAAALLEAAGMKDRAAAAFEESGDYGRAVDLWQAAGEPKRSRRCAARALEKAKDFAAAAAVWLELGDKAAALGALEKTDDDPALGDIFRGMKLWEKAARSYAKCRRYADEADCWRRAKNQKRAADAYFAAKDWEKAARYYALARSYEKILECWQRAGRFDKVVAAHFRDHDYTKALAACRRWLQSAPEAADAMRSAAAAYTAKKPLQAAVFLAALGENHAAGELFFAGRLYDMAITEFSAAGDHVAMAECLEGKNDYYHAAAELEKDRADRWEVTHLLERYVKNGIFGGEIDRKKADRLDNDGLAFEAAGDLSRAVNRFMAIGQVKKAASCFLKMDRDDTAFRFFRNVCAYDELGTFIREKRNFHLSRQAIQVEADLLQASWSTTYYLPTWPHLLRALDRSHPHIVESDAELREELALVLPMKDLSGYRLLTKEENLDIVDFLIRIGHLNGLYSLWRNGAWHFSAKSAYLKGFMTRIESAAAGTDARSAWFGALLGIIRQRTKGAALSSREIGPWNSLVYVFAGNDVRNVIEHHWIRSLFPELDDFGKYLRIEDELAAFAEAKSDFARAAAWYVSAKQWNEALRCYRAVKDRAGTAQMLEKIGAFGEALAIWESLGNKRDIARVKKAIASGKSAMPKGRSRPRKIEAWHDEKQQDLF